MKTKIISIILAVAIAVTGFTVRSSAIGEVLAGTIAGKILIGTAEFIAGSLGLEIGKNLTAEDFNIVEAIKDETVKNAVDAANRVVNMDSVKIYPNREYYNDGTYKTVYYASLNPDLNLTGDDLELANLIVNNLNSLPNLTEICNDLGTTESSVGGSTIAGGGGVSVIAYADLKKAIGNATTEYTYNKYKQFAMEQGIALENNGAVPVYDFNFVGPIPSIDMPEYYTMANEYMLDGFTFTKPTTKEKLNPEYVTTHGFDGWGVLTDTGYKYSGIYILYDEEIYFGAVYSEADSNGKMIAPTAGILSGVTQFVRSDGATLNDVTGLNSVPSDISMGIYLSSRSDLSRDSYPSLSAPTKINNNSFTVTSDGTVVEVPRTDKEQAIADGIDLGLVDEDGNIILDENGNIVSIDGLNIDKLMQLIQQIADNGSISFDSVEEYLAEISRLLRLANVDSAAMNTVISNLKELEKAQSKDISEINANVAAIAEALTAAKEANLEFETPDVSIFDKFPFSLPWDFYNVISLLCTEEKEPVFIVPLETNLQFGTLDYEVDEEIVLDLTVFKLNGYDVVQIFTSTTSYLFFIVCLIGATKKLLWK